MGESRSILRLILCAPWQSLHEGATINPIFNSAFPWMLSMYWFAASGNSIWYSLVRFVLLWHFAQVAGKFILYTGESVCFTGTISWLPWQSQHCAAPDAPILWLMPWMLVA